LNLSRNFLTEDGVESLVRGLCKGEVKLRSLDLAVNRAGDEGAETLSNEICKGFFRDLHFLSLRANAVGAAGPLCKALRYSQSLQELDVEENFFGDEDAERLMAAATAAGRPLCLRLAGSEMSDDFLETLMQGAFLVGLQEATQDSPETTSADPFSAWLGLEPPKRDALPESAGQAKSFNFQPEARMVPETSKSQETGSKSASYLDSLDDGKSDAGSSANSLPELQPVDKGQDLSQDLISAAPDADLGMQVDQAFAQDEISLPISREEWQDCLDTLEWAKSMLK